MLFVSGLRIGDLVPSYLDNLNFFTVDINLILGIIIGLVRRLFHSKVDERLIFGYKI